MITRLLLAVIKFYVQIDIFIKKLYLWLKNYVSSKPTCFSWLIHRLLAKYNMCREESLTQLPS